MGCASLIAPGPPLHTSPSTDFCRGLSGGVLGGFCWVHRASTVPRLHYQGAHSCPGATSIASRMVASTCIASMKVYAANAWISGQPSRRWRFGYRAAVLLSFFLIPRNNSTVSLTNVGPALTRRESLKTLGCDSKQGTNASMTWELPWTRASISSTTSILHRLMEQLH